MAITAMPSNIAFRPRDRKIFVVVEYANGTKAYARIDRDKAVLGGASLAAAVSQCQTNGVIPAGVVKRTTVAH